MEWLKIGVSKANKARIIAHWGSEQAWRDWAKKQTFDQLEPPPPPPPASPGRYGTCMAMDALGNSQVGGTDSGSANVWVDFYFRAEHSAPLTSFRAYWLDEDYPGYGGGNGGTFTVSVESDRNGVPSGTVLASISGLKPTTLFPEITFPSPANLTAGQVYHLVFRNTDPSPTVNFSSVNMCWQANPAKPRSPRWPDADWGMLRKFIGGSLQADWGEDSSDSVYSPILDLGYGNGKHQGNGYMEVEVGGYLVQGSQMARALFRPSAPVSVTGAMVRCMRASGGSGALTLSLKDMDGRTLRSTVVTSGIPSGDTDNDPDASCGGWVGGRFSESTSLVLAQGVQYQLVLSAPSGARIWSRGIQTGSAYGFHADTYFTDESRYEQTNNGGSSWWEPSGLAGASACQFYLTTG